MALPTSIPTPSEARAAASDPVGAAQSAAPAAASNTILPDGDTPSDDSSLCATIDEENNVLELIYSNSDGIYLRENGKWELYDSTEPMPTVDDQEWLDVNPQFVGAYDQATASSDGMTREDVVPYSVAQV